MTRRGVYRKKVGVMVMIPYDHDSMILLLESEGSLYISAVPSIAPVSRRLERHNRVGDVGAGVSADMGELQGRRWRHRAGGIHHSTVG